MSRIPVLSLVVPIVLGLLLGGCNDSLVSATVDTPQATQKGTATLTYRLLDGKGLPATVTVEFSADGGITFRPATGAAGAQTANLVTSKSGFAHGYPWDSQKDLGFSRVQVIVRITPANPRGTGSAGSTGAFTVDNSGSNIPPQAAIVSPKGGNDPNPILVTDPYFGPLVIDYTLVDPEQDAASVRVEHSTDQGKTWRAATLSPSSLVKGLATGKSAPAAHRVVWLTRTDLGNNEVKGVLIRVTPFDTKQGFPALSGYVVVDNRALGVEYPVYLQSATPTSVVVVWKTDKRTGAELEWGTSASPLNQTVKKEESTFFHEVSIAGLQPGAVYYYRARSAGVAVSAVEWLRTANPPAQQTFSFVALGDSGKGSTEQHAIAAEILKAKPDFVLHTGDVIYPSGEEADYSFKFFGPYQQLLKNRCWWLALGNHDVSTAGGAAYLKIFRLPANNPAATERYYSFDYGHARFICLDTNIAVNPGSPQYVWFENELKKTTSFWKIVFFHHPPYSASKGDRSNLQVRNALSPLFEQYEVDLVINGHEHNYERTKVMKQYHPTKRGVVYVITGGGGASTRWIGSQSWTASAKEANHFTVFSISGKNLHIKAVDHRGRVIDSAWINR